jgi:hypothetical protein
LSSIRSYIFNFFFQYVINKKVSMRPGTLNYSYALICGLTDFKYKGSLKGLAPKKLLPEK